MRASHRISVLFGDDVAPVARRRITYALRVFAAVKGAEFLEEPGAADDGPRLCYGAPARRAGDVALESLYRPRPPHELPEEPVQVHVTAPDGESVSCPVFHGDDAASGRVDWLGELFEWLSGACELASTGRDAIGRVPYRETAHGRFALDPSVPYAAVAMTELDRAIARTAGGLWTAGFPSPWPDTALGVAATHDIDFLPDHAGALPARWVRNIAAGAFRMRSAAAASRAACSVLRPLSGRPWLHDALDRFREQERARGVGSTWTVVTRRGHRRDPTYRLESRRTRAALEWLASSGAEIGVHGSYTSLEGTGRLADEYDRLRAFGHAPSGGRQHWLRYSGDTLFRELVRADAVYDATAGFPDAVGFRHGACFPFPPYDFESERPFPLLELPLVLMDVALAGSHGPDAWLETSTRVLREASRWVWGGVSILWHDTAITNALHPAALGAVYFELIDGPGRFMSGNELVETVHGRYAGAGLPVRDPGGAS